MDDLISRAYVLAEYDRQHQGPPGGARKIMAEAPAVDAVPVVHGRWEEHEDCNGDSYYTCSACGCDWITIDGTPEWNGMRYCPECGAKMDGDA